MNHADFEELLKGVGREFADRVDVYHQPGQPNIHVLRFDHERKMFTLLVPFDCNGVATVEHVRDRIIETCRERIEWLSSLKSRVEKASIKMVSGKDVELPMDGKHHHIVEVCDGKTTKLYVDGELKDEV